VADAYNLIGVLRIGAAPRHLGTCSSRREPRAALDDRLAEAHCAVGCNALFLDWDWDVADRAFDRAIALNPSYAPAYYYRPPWPAVAASGMRRSTARDWPSSATPWTSGPVGAGLAADGEAAVGRCAAALEQVLELNADFLLANGLLGRVETARGNSKRALEVLEHAVVVSNRNPAAIGSLAEALTDAGRERESRALLGNSNSAVQPNTSPRYTCRRSTPHSERIGRLSRTSPAPSMA